LSIGPWNKYPTDPIILFYSLHLLFGAYVFTFLGHFQMCLTVKNIFFVTNKLKVNRFFSDLRFKSELLEIS